jgi:hypothetical protein
MTSRKLGADARDALSDNVPVRALTGGYGKDFAIAAASTMEVKRF